MARTHTVESGGAPPPDDRAGVARPTLRLFAAARQAAGTGSVALPGRTVGEVLDAATRQFGAEFAAVLATCRVWVNGQPADRSAAVGGNDEVAVLPPVSGGA